jgi:hypothetical protein
MTLVLVQGLVQKRNKQYKTLGADTLLKLARQSIPDRNGRPSRLAAHSRPRS